MPGMVDPVGPGRPFDALTPVSDEAADAGPGDEAGRGPGDGTALCLSGGGYRAMVFHLGALWRLNELGLLARLDRVSSVSGGSITAGVLGLAWPRLGFDGDGVAGRLVEEVVEPVRKVASTTIDRGAILRGALLPGSISSRVTKRYRRLVFGDATLQDLPADGEGPRFVINAVNVGSGALWRFSRPYMADWKVGRVDRPTVALADAVAASSAFPPVLSPTRLDVDPGSFTAESRGWPLAELQSVGTVSLSDGGVYDNLGLETAFKRYRTLLVSDGGGHTAPDGKPAADWARHSVRVLQLIDLQVRNLRKRQLVAAYVLGRTPGSPSDVGRLGAYWGIRSAVADYPLHDPIRVDPAIAARLAALPTRLAAVDRRTQEQLVNWGYAICDTALRAWYLDGRPCPAALPYPDAPIG
jgi:NTE family protein